MNGGTNLALAIERAGGMMKEKLANGSPRTIILLTDGRVDYYQGMSSRALHLQQLSTPACASRYEAGFCSILLASHAPAPALFHSLSSIIATIVHPPLVLSPVVSMTTRSCGFVLVCQFTLLCRCRDCSNYQAHH